ncbi:MAG: FtsH protease activity modulator HflK [Acidobacteriota bacterium]
MAQSGPGEPLSIPQFKPPRLPSNVVRLLIIAVLVFLVLSTSVYTIEPEENGVVVRFGAYVETTPPGLHFKLPLGIDKVYKLPVERQLSEEFGFRTAVPDNRRRARVDPSSESNMLTGDLNAAVVEWVVQYRINDAYLFTFKVRDIRETLRDMAEAAMREVVGDRTVNEVLTVGRGEIESVIEVNLQALCDEYQMGIAIEDVILQNVTPPDPVKPAFNEVNQAQQEKEKLINQAQSEYNKTVPRAEGVALQAIQAAEGYALDRVNRAQGEATRFSDLYAAYSQAPEVTRRRIYLETMNEVLPRIERKIVVDDDAGGVLPLLNLDGQSTRRGAAAAAAASQGGGN